MLTVENDAVPLISKLLDPAITSLSPENEILISWYRKNPRLGRYQVVVLFK